MYQPSQAMKVDRRAVPRSGERVPYVVVYGEPGLPLIQLVRWVGIMILLSFWKNTEMKWTPLRPPAALLDQPHLRINGLYYITKVPCAFKLLTSLISKWCRWSDLHWTDVFFLSEPIASPGWQSCQEAIFLPFPTTPTNCLARCILVKSFFTSTKSS